jgi:outer membrane murein-binding lipoprotein Lpp
MSDASQNVEIVEERWVEFYGDTILAALAKIEGKTTIIVPVRPVCEVLGVNWPSQWHRIKRDDVLGATVVEMTTVARDGKRRKMAALPLEYLHGWLFGVSASQVKEEHREKITLYRRECFQVLSAAFSSDLLLSDRDSEQAEEGMTLAQVRDLGAALMRTAEEQMQLRARVDETYTLATDAHERLDKAADVIKALQRRMGTVEERLGPGEKITSSQQAALQDRVKGLAHLLTERDPSKNHFGGVWGALNKQMNVSSYKDITQGQYDAAVTFLEDWRQAVAGNQLPGGEEQ